MKTETKGRQRMKKYEHLPVYGIGPVYVISILLLTVVAVLLRNLTVLSTGRLTILRIPLIVMGILFIILFVVYVDPGCHYI